MNTDSVDASVQGASMVGQHMQPDHVDQFTTDVIVRKMERLNAWAICVVNELPQQPVYWRRLSNSIGWPYLPPTIQLKFFGCTRQIIRGTLMYT